MSNIYKQAAVQKLRFESVKGLLTVEQLFELPLTSKQGFDLDSVAKGINAKLKAHGEESFVDTAGTNPAATELRLKLEIVKDVIAHRQDELARLRDAASRKAQKDRLTDLLAEKEDEALKALSPEELRKRIAELG